MEAISVSIFLLIQVIAVNCQLTCSIDIRQLPNYGTTLTKKFREPLFLRLNPGSNQYELLIPERGGTFNFNVGEQATIYCSDSGKNLIQFSKFYIYFQVCNNK